MSNDYIKVFDQAGFTDVLDHDALDCVTGQILSSGQRVILSPLARNEVAKDTQSNRQLFSTLGWAWSSAVRDRIWLNCLHQIQAPVGSFRGAGNIFLANISTNLNEIVGEPFPEKNAQSNGFFGNIGSFFGVAQGLTIERVSELPNLSDDLHHALVDILFTSSGLPIELHRNPEVLKNLGQLCQVRVFEVCSNNNSGQTRKVLAILVTLLATEILYNYQVHLAEIRIVPASSGIVSELKKSFFSIINTHIDKAKPSESVIRTYYSIASDLGWSEEVIPFESPEAWFAFTNLADINNQENTTGWNSTVVPTAVSQALPIRNFIRCMRPESRQHRLDRVVKFIEQKSCGALRGNIRFEDIAIELNMVEEEVESCCYELKQSGKYQVYLANPEDQKSLSIRKSRK